MLTFKQHGFFMPKKFSYLNYMRTSGKKIILGVLLSLVFSVMVCAQQNTKAEITNLIEQYQDYFKQDRKSIHLHLNKTTFASGEHIWFSTYIFNKKTNRIDDEDTYIYVDLINSAGAIVASKTIAYSETSGTGEFYLDPQMVSGDYFLQAYTMEMNAFAEDDSSIYPIRVINFESNIILETPQATKIEDLRVTIQPESGQLLENVFGTCGIQIVDKNEHPVRPDSVVLSTKVVSGKSVLIPINSMGIGKFSLTPKKGTQHLIKTYFNNKILTTLVPFSKKYGYSIAADHNYAKNQLLVAIHTNEATQTKNTDSLKLVIHKDGNIFTLPVSIDKGELSQNIIIPYTSLFPGVNTLSLLNSNEVIAERMVFNQPKNEKLRPRILKANRSNDTITLYIKNYSPKESTSLNKASISVLPAENKSLNTQKSMTSAFFLDGYVPTEFIKRIQKTSYLEKNMAKYDLDVFLLAQGKHKYQWRNILRSSKNYTRNRQNTASISGYVNMFDATNDSMQVMLYSSMNGIFETIPLDEEKKFKFEAIALAKKSKISMTLLDKKGQPVYANFFFTIQPTKKPYRFPYKPKAINYAQKTDAAIASNPSLFKKVEQLDEVVVTENRLKYERFFGNFNGRKIDSTALGYVTLENFIRSYGFRMKFVDPQHPDPIRAASRELFRNGTDAYGNKFDIFPAISINGYFTIYLMDFAHIRMEHIDEVYYKRGRTSDYFAVFTNDDYENRPLAEVDKNSKTFIVENGHDLPKEFIRPPYYAFDNDSYKRYGVVSWIPDIVSNKQGVLSFKIPDDGQSKLNLHLEGFGEHGEYLSDVLTVDLNKELR